MDETFADFKCVYKKPVTLHKHDIPDDFVRVLYGENKVVVLDVRDIPQEYAQLRTYFFVTKLKSLPHTPINDTIVRFYFLGTDCIVYPYINIKTVEYMNAERIPQIKHFNMFLDNAYTRASIIVKLSKLDGKYTLDYYVNSKIFYNVVNGKREPKFYMLKDIFNHKKREQVMNTCDMELEEILQNPVVGEQLVGLEEEHTMLLKPDVTLYNYQKRDTIWMESIEKKVKDGDNMITLNFSRAIPVLDNCLLYQSVIVPKNYFNDVVHNNIITFRYFGGNLISEVGLGKTMIALYYCFLKDSSTREKYNYFVEFAEGCTYFYKRGKNKGSTCGKELVSQLYCSEHNSTLFNDKRSLKYKNLESFDPSLFIKCNKIQTNATLVIAPNQLCDQWVSEYYNKFVNDKRVVLLVTYDQYKNLVLADLLFADLVVVSTHFLANPFYEKHALSRNNQCVLENFGIGEKYSSAQQLLESKEFNVFNYFHWNRVYLDEAHELQGHQKFSHIKWQLKAVSADYFWNITGTPFSHGIVGFLNSLIYTTSYGAYLEGLCVGTLSSNLSNIDVFTLMSMGLGSGLVKKCDFLYRRNTKMSIKKELEANVIREYIKMLQFSSQERTI
ncbi:hypothetical protein EB118_21895, partial [bacterium]|nr:hypothetical protein [bacterium]